MTLVEKMGRPVWEEVRELREAVEARRPDLAQEWSTLENRPTYEVGLFLHEHFPIPGVHWGGQSFDGARRLLEQHYPLGG